MEIEVNWMELITNMWLGVGGTWEYAETHYGQEGSCYMKSWGNPWEESCGSRMSHLERALVEGYTCLKRPSREEGAEENKYPDLILLIHSSQAKHPRRGSAGEKVGKCVWWGILKIFWAQQALKITKTISKGDRAVQMWRVKALWRAAARRKWKERSSWRSLHVRDLALRLQLALSVVELCNSFLS